MPRQTAMGICCASFPEYVSQTGRLQSIPANINVGGRVLRGVGSRDIEAAEVSVLLILGKGLTTIMD